MFQAHPTFLTDSTFALDPSRPIGNAQLIAQIRRFHIRVRLDCDPYYKPEAVRKTFSGLDDLQIEIFRSSFGLCGYEALDGFLGVRGVSRARVYGSVDPIYARRLEELMERDEDSKYPVREWWPGMFRDPAILCLGRMIRRASNQM